MLTREQFVGRSAQDVEKDMRMQSMYARCARIAGESASQFRAEGNEVVISYLDALQALDTMRRDGLPDWLRNAIMAVAIDDDTANTIMSRILSAELQQDDFDRPVADIFERVQFSTAENNLATALRAWADFYGNSGQ